MFTSVGRQNLHNFRNVAAHKRGVPVFFSKIYVEFFLPVAAIIFREQANDFGIFGEFNIDYPKSKKD